MLESVREVWMYYQTFHWLFQGFLLFLIAKIILDISYTKRDYLAILVVIIPSLLYIYLGSISVLYLLIGCGLILYTKVKSYSLIVVLSSAILMFLVTFRFLICCFS